MSVAEIERHACPGCGSCSGMFTANSMNCLNEAIGLALPGNGTIVATHANRQQLFRDAAALIVKNAYKYYEEGDDSVLPRSIATREAFLNAMTLDIAMGGSTNTVLHLLAIAHEAEVDFRMDDIDMLSRRVPLPLQGGPQHPEVSYSGCKPCRRNSRYSGRTFQGRLAGHLGSPGRWYDIGRSYCPL